MNNESQTFENYSLDSFKPYLKMKEYKYIIKHSNKFLKMIANLMLSEYSLVTIIV